jgi:hypothetical protein
VKRILILALLSIAAVSCSNPFSTGPGRVAVSLEEASVRTIENEALFPHISANVKHVQRQVIQFRISSRTDLLKYFEDWQRLVQVRCSVDGSANGRAYRDSGYGPRLERVGQDGVYHYLVYAFVDLTAWDVEREGGKPATTLDLTVDRFESLGCHIIGVQKAPVLFPRTNEFVVPASMVHDLIRKESIQ